jgi:hypothetical protein
MGGGDQGAREGRGGQVAHGGIPRQRNPLRPGRIRVAQRGDEQGKRLWGRAGRGVGGGGDPVEHASSSPLPPPSFHAASWLDV